MGNPLAELEKLQRRHKIVKGDEEPNEEELAGAGADDTEETNAGGAALLSGKAPRGIPQFWLTVLKNQDTTVEYIEKQDERALEHLENIRCSQPKSAEGYRVEFQFRSNPYFSDKVLVKEVHLPYPGAPLSQAANVEQLPVRWKSQETNLTVKLTTKSVKKKGGKGKKDSAAPAASTVRAKPCPSFFTFFSSTPAPKKSFSSAQGGDAEDEGEERAGERLALEEQFVLEAEDDGVGQVSAAHLEILMTIWQEVVPKAAQLYTSQGFAAAGEQQKGHNKDDADDEENYGTGAARGGVENLHPDVRLRHLHEKQKRLRVERDSQVARLQAELEGQSAGIFSRRRALVVGEAAADSSGHTAMAVPRFWLLALKGCPTTVELIRRRDEALLAHLTDVRCRRQSDGPGLAVEFEFGKGAEAWMANRVLSKTFVFAEEIEAVRRTESTPVRWRDEDRNVTAKENAAGKLKSCPSSWPAGSSKRDGDDDEASLKKKLAGKGKRRKRDEDRIVCCGLSRNAVLALLMLLAVSSQAFLYLDYFLMKLGY
eukprot:jgi/Mesen1/1681/ME000137S00599